MEEDDRSGGVQAATSGSDTNEIGSEDEPEWESEQEINNAQMTRCGGQAWRAVLKKRITAPPQKHCSKRSTNSQELP